MGFPSRGKQKIAPKRACSLCRTKSGTVLLSRWAGKTIRERIKFTFDTLSCSPEEVLSDDSALRRLDEIDDILYFFRNAQVAFDFFDALGHNTFRIE